MRKFLFFLILLPAFASLGHDMYIFSKNPDKGFGFMDLGAIWDQYHKESHDQWKMKVQEIGETVQALSDSVMPDISLEKTAEETSSENVPDYMESFSQMSGEGRDSKVASKVTHSKPSIVQDFIGFILEQKAVFVFSFIALFVYLVNLTISRLLSEKSGMDKVAKHKRKKQGKYEYARK